MRLQEIREMVSGTADAAFAVEGMGVIVAWNRAAEELFGVDTAGVLGQRCGDILQGLDECGQVCSDECTIRQSVLHHHPVRNFDLQVATAHGMEWHNVSVLILGDDGNGEPYSIHILRPIDIRKRLEIVMRDFCRQGAGSADPVPPDVNRAPAASAPLSERELEVLRLLASGFSTATIAERLHISRSTVNNHMQHILQKLNVHSRLEAIRRAEHAGLI